MKWAIGEVAVRIGHLNLYNVVIKSLVHGVRKSWLLILLLIRCVSLGYLLNPYKLQVPHS